jgi:hypothetical protein
MTKPQEPRSRPYREHRRPPPGEWGLWVSTTEAAEVFGVSERTIRRRCRSGALACTDYQGWMVRSDQVPPPEPDAAPTA